MKFCLFHDFEIEDVYTENWKRCTGKYSYYTVYEEPIYKDDKKYFVKCKCSKCGKVKYAEASFDEFSKESRAKIKIFLNNKKEFEMNSKERCSECGKLTQYGEKVHKESYKENPIWYEDKEEFKKPVSELIESLRNDLTRIRGKLGDIVSAYGWGDYIEDIQGNLTCSIVALADANDRIIKFENKK